MSDSVSRLEQRIAQLERQSGKKSTLKDYENRARRSIQRSSEDADEDFDAYVRQVEQLLATVEDLAKKLTSLSN
jgi:chromosome segregation ATPase